MRLNEIIGKQHWQACYSVPFIDIHDIFHSWIDFGVYIFLLFPCHYDVHGV